MLRDEIRREIRARLEAAFRDRLQGVLLFGSAARGEENQESDLDLMVLLKEPVRLGKDLENIVDALYPLQLTIDAPIHAMPVSAQTFEAGEFGIYRNAKREGAFL
jgi:predicted nucleotidyltransferase